MSKTSRWQLLGAWVGGFALAAGCGYTFQTSDNPLLARYAVRKVYILPFDNNTYKPGVENVVYNEVLKVIAANHKLVVVSDPDEADAILQGTISDASYAAGAQTTADNLFPTSGNTQGIVIDHRPGSNTPVATAYRATLSANFALSAVGPYPFITPTPGASPIRSPKPPTPSPWPRGIPSPTPSPSPKPLPSRRPYIGPEPSPSASPTGGPIILPPGHTALIWSGGFQRTQAFPGNNQLDVYGTTGALINESEFDRSIREMAELIARSMHESMLAGF